METPEYTGERRQGTPLLQGHQRCLRGSLTHDPEDYAFSGHVSGRTAGATAGRAATGSAPDLPQCIVNGGLITPNTT